MPDHGENSYQGHDRLAGKVALITRADSGIGMAVALAYVKYCVYLSQGCT